MLSCYMYTFAAVLKRDSCHSFSAFLTHLFVVVVVIVVLEIEPRAWNMLSIQFDEY